MVKVTFLGKDDVKQALQAGVCALSLAAWRGCNPNHGCGNHAVTALAFPISVPTLFISRVKRHSHPLHPSLPTTSTPSPFSSMASSLPPNGLSSANVSRAHSQANDILQKDASRGNVPVHSFDPNATPAEKAAEAGQARSKLSSVTSSKASDVGKGSSLLHGFATSCQSTYSFL